VRYGHLVLYAAILLGVYGLVRPGSAAGRAVTSVTGAMTGVLRQGLNVVGGKAVIIFTYGILLFLLVRRGSQGPMLVTNAGNALGTVIKAGTGGGTF